MPIIGVDLRSLLTSHFSGIPQYLFSILKEINKQKEFEVRGWYNQRKHAQLPSDIATAMKITATRTPNKLLNMRLTTTRSTAFDKVFADSNLVWMPDINFWSPVKGKKLVVTVHDLSYLRFPEFFTLKSRIWTSLSRAKKLLRTADHLIAVSHSTKQDLMELLGINQDKISVVHEGVDVEMSTKQSEQEISRVQTKYNLPQKYILYVGTLEPRKNIESVIKAAQHAKLPLVIAGKLGWKYASILKAIKNSPTPIHYLGYIPKEDKPALYAGAYLFLWPSYYEGFGLPVIEAQSQGVPVITSSTSSLGEITQGSALLVNPYKQDEINNALTLLLEDEEYYATLQQKGLANAARFSWEQSAQETLAVFTKLI